MENSRIGCGEFDCATQQKITERLVNAETMYVCVVYIACSQRSLSSETLFALLAIYYKCDTKFFDMSTSFSKRYFKLRI